MDFRLIIIFSLFGFIYSKVIDLSCGQIEKFVKGHNARRLRLARGQVPKQPAADDMKYIIWDDELAGKAAKWASNNKFQHNPDRTVPSGRFGTGENIFWSASNNPAYEVDLDSVMDSWFNEYKDYTYGPLQITDFTNREKQIGHYTQMAWANTIYVGCGISVYNTDNGFKNYLVVCNYGPTGNYLGQTPYKRSDKGKKKLKCGVENCLSKMYGSCRAT
ncbi:venom allergen 5-like [Aricia agestis]|uniref:venom allergen 5-like n=1 Tax=Aricia agestis TaxID=91739 RepID=UPI001C207939|nr:venom allergen 5-like [Aricia agestis]